MMNGMSLWVRGTSHEEGKPTPIYPAVFDASPSRNGDEHVQVDMDKPVMFCLSGQTATTPEYANGFAKFAETLLGGPPIHEVSDVQLVTAMYGKRSWLEAAKEAAGAAMSTEHQLRDWNARTEVHAHADTAYLVDHVFSRIIPDLNHAGDQRAEKLEECRHHFSNINFLGYSYGSYLLPYLHEGLQKKLEESGFSREERKQVLRGVHAVTIGELGLWYNHSRDVWDFTSVHFASTHDERVGKIAGIDPSVLELRHTLTEADNDELFGAAGNHRQRELVWNKTSHIERFGEDGNLALYLGDISNVLLMIRREKVEKGEEANGNGEAKYHLRERRFDSHDPLIYSGIFPDAEGGGGQVMMRTALQNVMRNNVASSGTTGRRTMQLPELFNPVALIEQSRLDPEQQDAAWSAAFTKHFAYNERVQKLLASADTYTPRLPERDDWGDFIRARVRQTQLRDGSAATAL